MGEREQLFAAAEQAQAYQRRIDNQRNIIDRYDRFRNYVLDEVLPLLREWQGEIMQVVPAMTEDDSVMTVEQYNLKRIGDALNQLVVEIQQRGEAPQ